MTTARADLPTIRIRRGPEAATVLRAAARTVVAVGLLIAGFVAYQFGITSLLATRAQSGLEQDLGARFAAVETVGVPFEIRELPQAPYAVDGVPAFDPASVPGLDLSSLEPFAGSLPGEDFDAPFVISEPLPLRGEALGRIVVPSAGVDWTVVEGVTRADLKTGAGHMPDSALPGQQGNAVISGHRTTYGAPFLHLDRVEVGDAITVETATGLHVYQVVDSFVVDPGETWVTTQWEGAWLTLTTCEPVLSSAQRLVVVATLVAGPNAGVILAGQ
jgi:sortase A